MIWSGSTLRSYVLWFGLTILPLGAVPVQAIGGQDSGTGSASPSEEPRSRPTRQSPPARPEDRAREAFASERAAVHRFLRAKLEDGREHYRRRQYQAAFRIADAILTLDPEVPFRAEVRRLRRSAEARHVATSVVLVTFESPAETGFPVSLLEGSVLVENIGSERLQIGLGAEQTLGLCEYVLFEFYGDGSEWTTQGTIVVHATSDFQLDPGESKRLPLTLDIPRGKGTPVMQYFSVTGMFRPRSLRAGDEFVARNVPWESAERLIMAEDLRSLTKDPWQTLKDAYERYDGRLVAAAGFYWIWELKQMGQPGEKRREETIEYLLAQLDPELEKGLDRLTMRLLEQVTGVQLKPTKETWFRWARRRSG